MKKIFTTAARQLSPACALITSGQTIPAGCVVPVRGVSPDVILINYDDYTDNYSSSTNIITTITAANPGFTWEGLKTSTKPVATKKEGTYEDSFELSIQMVSFSVTAAIRKQLQAGVKVVALLKHNEKGASGATKWNAWGRDTGLYIRDLVWDLNSPDTGGITFTLKTLDDQPSATLPVTVFITDEATTDTLIAGLLT